MAECMAARLACQENQIQLLTQEIIHLRDGLIGGKNVASAPVVTPELERLRGENEKLKYRLVHLRRGLQAERQLEAAGKKPSGGPVTPGTPKEHPKPQPSSRGKTRVAAVTMAELSGAIRDVSTETSEGPLCHNSIKMYRSDTVSTHLLWCKLILP